MSQERKGVGQGPLEIATGPAGSSGKSFSWRMMAGFFAVILCTGTSWGTQAKAPETETPAREVQALSQIVKEMITLLEAEVADPVIETWFGTVASGDPEQLRPLSAQEVVALTRAGASDELLRTIVGHGLPRQDPPAPPEPPAAPASPVPPAPASPPAISHPPAPAKTPAVEVPVPAPSPNPRPQSESRRSTPEDLAAPKDKASVRFWTIYRPKFEEEEDPWDLYVYLDGELLLGVPGSGPGREPKALTRPLSPGLHHLLVVQERHGARKRDADGWFHEARLWPQTLPFTVEAGRSFEVALRFDQGGLNFRPTGALTLQVLEGGRELASQTKVGPPPEDWQRLCEEVEANLREDGSGPLSLRLQLKHCVRWSEAWPDHMRDLPSREELRKAQAEAGYWPTPS